MLGTEGRVQGFFDVKCQPPMNGNKGERRVGVANGKWQRQQQQQQKLSARATEVRINAVAVE